MTATLLPPAHLDDLARVEWSRVLQLRKFRPGESTLLEAYVRSWSRWQQAETRLAAEGPTLQQPLPKGRSKIVENPLTRVCARYQRQTLSAARLLKLDRAESQPDEAENPFLALLDEDED